MKSFKTESKKVLDIMINSIYTHKEIFMRELLSNASDAIDKLYYKSLTGGISGLVREDFEIKVSADKENRTLRISDNGIGMTAEELEKNLGTIAKSGSGEFKKEAEANAEVNIIGQFGVGFYSAFMVADRVEVISRAYDGETAALWRSSGAEGYEVVPAQKEERGTEITLYLKADSEDEKYSRFLEEYTLRSLIKKYSDYIRYPIKLLAHVHEEKGEEDGKEVCRDEWQTVNSMVPIWKKNKKDVTKEEYDAFYGDTFYDEAPLRCIHTSAEGTVEYKALLFIPSHAPYNYYSKDFEKGLKLYTDGVLITERCAELLPDYFGFVKGLVDSQLTLNISRETIQHNRQLKLIAANLEKKIKNELADMMKNDRENYEKFFGEFGLQLKYGVYSDWGMHKELLTDLLLFRSLNTGKLVSLEEYVQSMAEGQTGIYYAAGRSADAIKCLPQCEKITAKGYDVLCLTDDIDEFAVKVIDKFEEKPFISVSSESVETEETEQDKDLTDFIKGVLGDEVSKVKCTSSLKNHPVCLSVEGELSIEMEKVLNSMPNAQTVKAEKVLELNVNHPMYERLRQWLESDKDKLTSAAKVLYQQARIIEGLPVENPTELAELVASFIAG